MAIFGLFGIDQATISAIARAVAAQLQPQFNRLGANMGTLNDQLGKVKADLDTIKSDDDIVKEGVTALQGQVTALAANVKDLQSQLAAANALTPEQAQAFADIATEAEAVKAGADGLVTLVSPPPPAPAQ